jgi:hypothetical protein
MRAGRAKRGTHGELVLPVRCPGDEQRRRVRAGDEQEECHAPAATKSVGLIPRTVCSATGTRRTPRFLWDEGRSAAARAAAASSSAVACSSVVPSARRARIVSCG